MPEPDHYATLGVAHDAPAEAIRRAYLTLARKLHPDVSTEPDAGERFKLVTSAYNVLSDPDKRREYELDLLEEQQFANGAPTPRRGDDSLMHLEITLRESVLGAKRKARVRGIVACCACDGKGFLPSEAVCAACQGTGRIHGEQDITVEVPAGANVRDRLCLPGLGEAGFNGGDPGDLYIELRVAADEVFSREGNSLLAELHLTVCDAVLGAELTIDTWDGPLAITIPAGIQPGTVLDFPGHGVPITADDAEGESASQTGERGALLMTVEVDVPTDLNAPQRQALEWFRDMRLDDVSGLGNGQSTRQRRAQRSLEGERV